jgi:hypothetical protein
MTTLNVKVTLSDYQAHMLEILSKKTNIDATNLISLAIDEYIEKNLAEEGTRYFFDHKHRWKKTMDEADKEWRLHWNLMNRQQKKQFDDTLKKGLELAKEDPDIPYTWTGYVHSGELPPMETHPDIEWHRLTLLWHSKVTKHISEDLVFLGRMREIEKRVDSKKKKKKKDED